MKTEFTKGEWTCSEVMNFTDTLVSFIECDGQPIAQTRGDSKEITKEEAEANAKLIAAAPYGYEKHGANIELCDKLLDQIMKGNKSNAILILSEIKSNSIKAIKKATE